jgi:hypothetical protein
MLASLYGDGEDDRMKFGQVPGIALLIASCLGNIYALTYSEQVIGDGAIHYWRFEETSLDQPAADEIPDRPPLGSVPAQTNNPGVYTGGVTLGHDSAFPTLGNAVRFDEQDGTYIALGTPQHPGHSISVEAWVFLENGHTVGFSPIIARWDGSYELDVNHRDQGGELDFVIRNDANAVIDPHGDGPMSTNQWHHVVGIFSGESDGGGGTGVVYLDGERQIDFVAGGNLRDAGGDDGQWYIGRSRNPTSGFAWLGVIDEVAIYPLELTEAQIKNHISLAMGINNIPGDFNGDGAVNFVDIDLLSAEVRAGRNRLPFDLNGDREVNDSDRSAWVIDVKKTWFGDSNLDILFDSSDLVEVFRNGKFELSELATWPEGDWNGDGFFDSGDLVTAFTDGGFELGPRPMRAVVPEPKSSLPVFIALWEFRRRFACKSSRARCHTGDPAMDSGVHPGCHV